MRRIEVDVVSLVLVVVALAVFFLSGIVLYKTLTDAAEAHRALCTLKSDKEAEVARSEAFLRMSIDQRVTTYGEALGHTPETVVESNVRDSRNTLESLSFLRCE